MTATVSGPARIWMGAHRLLLIAVAFAVALAAAATIAVVLSTSGSGTSSTSTPWPVSPDTLSDKEKCEMARVREC